MVAAHDPGQDGRSAKDAQVDLRYGEFCPLGRYDDIAGQYEDISATQSMPVDRTSDLWLGLGIGSVIGALVYRFSRTSKAKKLKKKVCDAFHKISGQAEEMLDTAKEKVLDTGAAVADKVADKTFDLAEKADDLKGKMHTIAADAKK